MKWTRGMGREEGRPKWMEHKRRREARSELTPGHAWKLPRRKADTHEQGLAEREIWVVCELVVIGGLGFNDLAKSESLKKIKRARF